MSTAAKRKPREEVTHEPSDYAKKLIENALNSNSAIEPLTRFVGMLEHAAYVAPIMNQSRIVQDATQRGLDDGFVTGWGARAMIDIARTHPDLSGAEQAVLVEAAKANARVLVEEHNAKKRVAK